jgi:predicted Zn-ribbon and HTH transcriptional regulator
MKTVRSSAVARSVTARQALRSVLVEEPRSARELSVRVGLSEREVLTHLEHLERSLGRADYELVIEPASCIECGFAFHKRGRLQRPGRCPVCRGRRIQPPRFGVQPRRR